MTLRPKTLGIYRLQLDVVVVADSLDDAFKRLGYRGQIAVRGWTQTTIRDSRDGWINSGWRVEDDGEKLTVEPKRKRKAVA